MTQPDFREMPPNGDVPRFPGLARLLSRPSGRKQKMSDSLKNLVGKTQSQKPIYCYIGSDTHSEQDTADFSIYDHFYAFAAFEYLAVRERIRGREKSFEE